MGKDPTVVNAFRNSLQQMNEVLFNKHAKFGLRGQLTAPQRAIHVPAIAIGEKFLAALRLSQEEMSTSK